MSSRRRACIASTRDWGTVPRPTSGWFVATTSAKPAAFKARQPSWAPSYRRNSPTLAGGNGLPSRPPWTFSVPSRSRKTAGPSAILLGLGRHRLPFGLVYLEVGMGDEQVPDDRLGRLAVARDAVLADGRRDDAGVGYLGRVAPV